MKIFPDIDVYHFVENHLVEHFFRKKSPIVDIRLNSKYSFESGEPIIPWSADDNVTLKPQKLINLQGGKSCPALAITVIEDIELYHGTIMVIQSHILNMSVKLCQVRNF